MGVTFIRMTPAKTHDPRFLLKLKLPRDSFGEVPIFLTSKNHGKELRLSGLYFARTRMKTYYKAITWLLME